MKVGEIFAQVPVLIQYESHMKSRGIEPKAQRYKAIA
jgi:hypothetical protein